MSEINCRMWISGILWEVEIGFCFNRAEPSTGLCEGVDVESVWLLGFYPEQNASKRDYVSVNIKVDLEECTPKEQLAFENAVNEYISHQAREAFDYNHSYED